MLEHQRTLQRGGPLGRGSARRSNHEDSGEDTGTTQQILRTSQRERRYQADSVEDNGRYNALHQRWVYGRPPRGGAEPGERSINKRYKVASQGIRQARVILAVAEPKLCVRTMCQWG